MMKTVAAAQRADNAQWAIGDALIAEIKPGKRGENTGIRKRLEECARELAGQGLDYEVNTLRLLRRVAAAFGRSRERALGFEVCRAAGSPERLDLMVATAKRANRKLTVAVLA